MGYRFEIGLNDVFMIIILPLTRNFSFLYPPSGTEMRQNATVQGDLGAFDGPTPDFALMSLSSRQLADYSVNYDTC